MEYIKSILKKSGWISILESVVFALLGIIIICNPAGTLKFISTILGILFICFGIYKIANYIMKNEKFEFFNYESIYGLMAIVIGIVIIRFSSTVGDVFRITIGIWIIYSAFMRIGLSIKLKTVQTNIWIYSIIIALIMLICGLYITLNSGTIVITIGVMMVISSILDIIEDIIYMKNVEDIF